jgi:hypothetical protein
LRNFFHPPLPTSYIKASINSNLFADFLSLEEEKSVSST